jgi:hypothetical protein
MVRQSVRALLLVFLLTTSLWAATDPFAGTWKLNPAKSKLVDQMKVNAAGAHSYIFRLSPTNPRTIVADGTD